MGQALYRKYRSKKLSEIVGQEHITQTLEAALKQGKISHAYLFTGPRGVGKTSIARILAHEINGLPYDDDSMHLDIIEIDAASNRRIDEIRDLRDKVYIAPTSAQYKVYIIDEVHMLTKEAFNALLKTLEEPPAHAVFILATTDAHKLPETIVSRTQRFTFRPVEKSKVTSHLKDIAKQEKIIVSDEALDLLAEHGEGSFRDSISLLDQAGSNGKAIDLEDIQQMLGIPPVTAIAQLSETLTGGEPSAVMQQLSALYNQGYQAAAIARLLAERLRTQLMEGTNTLSVETTLAVLEKLVETPASYNPERYLEICLLQIQAPQTTQHPEVVAVAPTVSKARNENPASKATPASDMPPESPTDTTPEPPLTHQEGPQQAGETTAVLDTALWPQVLQALKQHHNTLYGVVRMAEPSFPEPGTLRIAFAFAFHQKRLNDARNKQILIDTIHGITGKSMTIECILDKSAKAAKPVTPTPAPSNNAGLNTISNIFGGGELLES